MKGRIGTGRLADWVSTDKSDSWGRDRKCIVGVEGRATVEWVKTELVPSYPLPTTFHSA